MVEALAGAGLLQMYVPRTMGGSEVPPLTTFRVIEEILAGRWLDRLVHDDRDRRVEFDGRPTKEWKC